MYFLYLMIVSNRRKEAGNHISIERKKHVCVNKFWSIAYTSSEMRSMTTFWTMDRWFVKSKQDNANHEEEDFVALRKFYSSVFWRDATRRWIDSMRLKPPLMSTWSYVCNNEKVQATGGRQEGRQYRYSTVKLVSTSVWLLTRTHVCDLLLLTSLSPPPTSLAPLTQCEPVLRTKCSRKFT